MKQNFTKWLLGIVVLAAAALTACDKKDPEPRLNDIGCQLTEMSYNGTILTYEYDSEDRLRTIISNVPYNGTFVRTLITYTYNSAGNLVKRTSESNDLVSYHAFRYANGAVSEKDYYENGVRLYTEVFTNDAKGRPVKVEDDRGYERTYTYNSKGNLTESAHSRSGSLNYKITYANYDDKPRTLLATKGEMSPYDASMNNPGTVTYSYYNNGTVHSTIIYNIAYEYNDKGLPVNKTESRNDGAVIVYNYEYNCD